MMKKLLILFVLTIFIYSCQKEESRVGLNGSWKSIGSGWILKIQDSTAYKLYDVTSRSCIKNREGGLDEIQKNLKLKNDTLKLKKGVITYSFVRTSKVPELCKNSISAEKKNDPLYNFEVFAETVKEHYAFFELNEIDWENLYEKQKEKLKANPTDVELYKVIEETLEQLNDNHGFIEASEEVYSKIEESSGPDENEESKENLREYGDLEVGAIAAKHHLEENMTEDSWLIRWGKMNESIGYIQVNSMWLYADLEIPEELIEEMGYVDAYVETFHKMYEGEYIEKEVEGVSKIMDNVMKDLVDMESMVIDVRFNGGGQDAVSFEILSRFIQEDSLQIATQKLKTQEEKTSILPLYIEGKKQFDKPIYILTSEETGSAAEAFAIASMAMPNAYRIGSATSGAMSTALEKTLPNGWHFAISNEIYMDNYGNNYENIGIPVDYELNYSSDRQTFFRSVADNLENDKEDILKAIEALKSEEKILK